MMKLNLRTCQIGAVELLNQEAAKQHWESHRNYFVSFGGCPITAVKSENKTKERIENTKKSYNLREKLKMYKISK
jgi:hypothetical protein